MDETRFAAWTRSWRGMPSRRHLLRGLAAAGFGWGAARLPEGMEAKKKGKPKPRPKKDLCARDGSKCRRPGKDCKKQFCLSAPFTIAAKWTATADHDSFLFVPPQNATTGPAPWIKYTCTPDNSSCEEAYPFACFDGDKDETGDEVATIHHLLPGTYEYWIELFGSSPAGELTIVLTDSSGRVVRQWRNPAHASEKQVEWHVFDINGADGRVISIDELIDDPNHPTLPATAHDPATQVCPRTDI